MKTKQLDRKLVLNKKNIANLGNSEMNEVNGGGVYSDRYSDCISLCGTEEPSQYCTGWCSDEFSQCVGVSLCGL